MRRRAVIFIKYLTSMAVLASAVVLFQNCGRPIPTNYVTVYESSSLSDTGAQGLGFKVLSYEIDASAQTPSGEDPESKTLTWFSNGQVIETTVRQTSSGEVKDSTAVAMFALDQTSVYEWIKDLPEATIFVAVAGTSVPCDVGSRRYVAHRRDGSSVVLYEERECSSEFESNAYDARLVAKIRAIREMLR